MDDERTFSVRYYPVTYTARQVVDFFARKFPEAKRGRGVVKYDYGGGVVVRLIPLDDYTVRIEATGPPDAGLADYVQEIYDELVNIDSYGISYHKIRRSRPKLKR
jgi:hypothetical protein